MSTLAIGAVIVSLAVGPVVSAGAQTTSTTIKGHLIDVACGTEKGADSKAAAKHDKPCLEMDDCVKSGFGVMTADNKFYKFDAAANKNVRATIKSTDKASDWRITVVGVVKGDTITVQTLTVDK